MSKEMGNERRYLLFVLYGLLLTGGLLYYRFPSDAVRSYVEAQANQASPRLMVMLGEVRPSLMVGLKFAQAQVFLKDKPDRAFLKTDGVIVRPSPLSFVQGKRKYDFDCASGKGKIAGWMELSDDQGKVPLNASLEMRQVTVQNLIDLPALVGRSLEGILGGTLSYSGKKDMVLAGAGQADLRISDGKLVFAQPILGLDAVRFDELLIQMTFRNMSVNLTRVELFGQELQGTLSGSISLRRDILESRLNLRGTMEPFSALFDGERSSDEDFMIVRQRLKGGRLSFVITGTLTDPKLRFI